MRRTYSEEIKKNILRIARGSKSEISLTCIVTASSWLSRTEKLLLYANKFVPVWEFFKKGCVILAPGFFRPHGLTHQSMKYELNIQTLPMSRTSGRFPKNLANSLLQEDNEN
jgi:hypothetical protein